MLSIQFQMYARIRLVRILIALLTLPACTLFPDDKNINEVGDGQKHTTRARATLTKEDLDNKPFVGVAISGGGSRAANFGAAVLQELDKHGFMRSVTAISAVSGGTLPAVYYTSKGHDQDWSWERLQATMRTNFFSRLLWKHLNPISLFRYVFSPYNRSDMMAEVFDDTFLHGTTFGDLGTGQPYILINGTFVPSDGRGMTFTDDVFESLRSRIDTYKVSNALAGSTAVPGAFHGSTLRSYSDPSYQYYLRVLDGGVSENLGLEPLLGMVAEAQTAYFSKQDVPPLPCFIFLIDSFGGPSPIQRPIGKRESRSGTDYIFDQNVWEALDTTVTHARNRLLSDIGPMNWEDHATFSIKVPRAYVFTADPPYRKPYTCEIWHLSFGRLASREPDVFNKHVPRSRYGQVVAIQTALHQIKTHWRLTAEGTCNEQDLQDALYDAAHIAVSEQTGRLYRTRQWFYENGLLTDEEAREPPETEGPYKSFENGWSLKVEDNPANGSTQRLLCERTLNK